jgi:hypothetical protein
MRSNLEMKSLFFSLRERTVRGEIGPARAQVEAVKKVFELSKKSFEATKAEVKRRDTLQLPPTLKLERHIFFVNRLEAQRRRVEEGASKCIEARAALGMAVQNFKVERMEGEKLQKLQRLEEVRNAEQNFEREQEELSVVSLFNDKTETLSANLFTPASSPSRSSFSGELESTGVPTPTLTEAVLYNGSDQSLSFTYEKGGSPFDVFIGRSLGREIRVEVASLGEKKPAALKSLRSRIKGELQARALPVFEVLVR